MNFIYKFLKYFNDAKAIKKGKVKESIYFRIYAKGSGKLFSKWFR